MFKEMGMHLTAEELKAPTAECMKNLYELYVEKMTGESKDEMRNVPFAVLDEMPHPQLHENGIAEMTFYKTTLSLMIKVGLYDISLPQLVTPDSVSTKRILSALINYAKFREERLVIYQELCARTEELEATKAQLEDDNDCMDTEITELREARAKVEPLIKQLDEDNENLKGSINKLNKENAVLREDLTTTKAALRDHQDKIANDHFVVVSAQQTADKLRAQVVRSPEKLQRTLATMQGSIEAGELDVGELSQRLRVLQAKGMMLGKVDNKVSKRVETIGECMADRNKCKEVRKEIKLGMGSIATEEGRGAELGASAEHLDRHIQACRDRLFDMQRSNEQKRCQAQQALDETERKKLDLSYSIQQDRSQLDANTAIIQRKQQELEWTRVEHEREMSNLQGRYANFGEQLQAYHQSMIQAL